MKDYSLIFSQVSKEIGVEIVPEYRFHPTRKWRFDYAIPQYKVAIEVEGGLWISGRHNRPISMIKDFEKYNEAAKCGWLLLRYTPQQLSINKLKEDIQWLLDQKRACL